jgi:tetratricopeptide (TPR) repeat protein
MQRVPTVRPISWPATIPQLAAVTLAVVVGWFTTNSASGAMWGAAVYLMYSFCSRTFIPRAHRRGIRLSQSQQYEEAIRAHEESYDFFTRHSWLDRYRAITMMSPSAMSYREMALINIAFAQSQIGNGEKAKEYYQQALDEFPHNGIAVAALNMIEAFERSSVSAESAE